MKVKIGKFIYDSEQEPIMIIMNDNDKVNISNTTKVHEDNSLRFTSFPKGMDIDKVRNWMYEDIKAKSND